MAASKGSRTHGHFYKGQKVVINESDPRLPWFRSGGFKQVRIEGTPGIMGSPAPAQTVKSNDAPKMYLSEELKSLLSENPKVGAAQLAVLEKAGLTTAEKVMTAGIDALLTLKGIGPASAEAIMDAVQPKKPDEE